MTSAAGVTRIGLLGGTFNPIHLGHLRAAEEVREALDLERVHFIPSNVPPHKRDAEHDPIASAAERLDWVERAIAPHKAGPQQSVEAMARTLQEKTPSASTAPEVNLRRGSPSVLRIRRMRPAHVRKGVRESCS